MAQAWARPQVLWSEDAFGECCPVRRPASSKVAACETDPSGRTQSTLMPDA
jgi:hypothetical protein